MFDEQTGTISVRVRKVDRLHPVSSCTYRLVYRDNFIDTVRRQEYGRALDLDIVRDHGMCLSWDHYTDLCKPTIN